MEIINNKILSIYILDDILDLKQVVVCLIESSFEYPQHMFWLRNKKNNVQVRTLICGLLKFILSISCNLCFGYSKEPFFGYSKKKHSFEYPRLMFRSRNKIINFKLCTPS